MQTNQSNLRRESIVGLFLTIGITSLALGAWGERLRVRSPAGTRIARRTSGCGIPAISGSTILFRSHQSDPNAARLEEFVFEPRKKMNYLAGTSQIIPSMGFIRLDHSYGDLVVTLAESRFVRSIVVNVDRSRPRRKFLQSSSGRNALTPYFDGKHFPHHRAGQHLQCMAERAHQFQ